MGTPPSRLTAMSESGQCLARQHQSTDFANSQLIAGYRLCTGFLILLAPVMEDVLWLTPSHCVPPYPQIGPFCPANQTTTTTGNSTRLPITIPSMGVENMRSAMMLRWRT